MPTKWRYTQKTINSIINNVSLERCLTDMFIKPTPFKGRGNFYIKVSPFQIDNYGRSYVCGKGRPFFISGKRRIFKCFQTGKVGTVINFIMFFLQINKKQAIKFICVKYNIQEEIVSTQYDDGSDSSLPF